MLRFILKFLLLLALAQLFFGIWLGQQYYQLAQRGERISATLQETLPCRPGHADRCVQLRFPLQSAPGVVRSIVIVTPLKKLGSLATVKHAGDVLPILYDPENPTHWELAGQTFLSRWGAWMGFMVYALFVFGLLILTSRSARRQRLQKAK